MGLLAEHADLVADAFGLGPGAVLSAGPVARGEHGLVWRLDTDRGAWAVKEMLRDPDDERDLDDELAFHGAAAAAGVPTPLAVRAVAGTVCAQVVPRVVVRVDSWADLLEPDPAGLDPAAVGEVLAVLHRVDDPGPRWLHPWYSEPVGARRWDELVQQLAASDRPGADRLAHELGTHRDEIVAMEQLLEPPRDPITCHRDLWANNVRTTPTGGISVIDWENCGLADPTQELAMVLFEFALDDPDRAEALHETYAAAGGRGRLRRAGDFSMLVAVLGHINERVLRLWLEPAAAPDEQDRLAAVWREFVDRPLTRQRIHDLLDAVA